jgi:3-deoxy-7-phosphoheptulonate synthase
MLVIMNNTATEADIAHVEDIIRCMGFTPKPVPGVQRTTICVLGNESRVEDEMIQASPGVKEVIHVTKPYKLVSREGGKESIVVRVGTCAFGSAQIPVIAGPCAIEDKTSFLELAHMVREAGAMALRGGAFKPRTSPYSFQGLGEDGLKILAEAREQTGLPVCTEAMDTEHLGMVSEYADIVQIGARNMQNFSLLRKAGRQPKPILLKRGMSATINELLMASEYVVSEGNWNVILCERGIRTFEEQTRNNLDLSAIPILHELGRLPIAVDPSHASGKRLYVPPLAKASVAAGADGLIIEVHQDPSKALSDGPQSILPVTFTILMRDMQIIAESVGRTM